MISLRAFVVAALSIAGALPIAKPTGTGTEATVMSLIVRPDSQRVDVVVGIQGDVTLKDFVLRGPDKIVVDISNATLGLKSQSYDHASRGGIVNVHYAQNKPNVVRVVVTLDGPRPYRLSRDAEGIRISVMGQSSTLPAWVAGYQTARLASEPPKSAIRRERLQPIAPTPISAPAIVINGRPVPVPQQQSQERRITINFENVPIIEVLKVFSAYSGRSIVPSNKVIGVLSANISDLPWDVALETLMNLNGFDIAENQFGLLTVDTYASINQKATATAAVAPLTTQSVQFNYTNASAVADILRTRLSRDCGASTVPANPSAGASVNATVDPTTGVTQPTVAQATAQPIITTGTCPVRGGLAFDTLTNSVHITDIQQNVDALVAYAKTLDRRQPQVNIKAKIILVDRTQLEGLGLQYDLGSQRQFFSDIIQRADSAGNPIDGTQISLGGNAIAAIANAGANVPGAALRLAYSTALGAFDFTTFFEALQTTSLLDVQAEPNGTVMNNQTLSLTAGSEVPIRTQEPGAGANSAGNVARVTVNLRQTGVILQVTPRVTNDGRVQMKVHVENSSVTFSGADAISFPKQSVDNVIMIADGATWVIGGLTQTSVTSTRTGIPLLMELPVIGRLFGVTNRQETKRDLLILITPHIVDPGQDAGTGRP